MTYGEVHLLVTYVFIVGAAVSLSFWTNRQSTFWFAIFTFATLDGWVRLMVEHG